MVISLTSMGRAHDGWNPHMLGSGLFKETGYRYSGSAAWAAGGKLDRRTASDCRHMFGAAGGPG